jgi:uncharacterized protein YbjQ (UPF0145 family)
LRSAAIADQIDDYSQPYRQVNTEYTEMMGMACAVVTNRTTDRAGAMGADAIINVRYMTTSVVGSAAELLVYGTAGKLSK